MSALADSMRGQKELRTLELSGNDMGDDGATHLANSLAENETMQSLHLGTALLCMVSSSLRVHPQSRASAPK